MTGNNFLSVAAPVLNRHPACVTMQQRPARPRSLSPSTRASLSLSKRCSILLFQPTAGVSKPPASAAVACLPAPSSRAPIPAAVPASQVPAIPAASPTRRVPARRVPAPAAAPPGPLAGRGWAPAALSLLPAWAAQVGICRHRHRHRVPKAVCPLMRFC